MKTCPYCSEQIQDGAFKCRFCGEYLPEVKPAKKAGPILSRVLAFLGLSLVLSYLTFSGLDGRSFPIFALALLALGFLGILLSLGMLRDRSAWRYILPAIALPVVVFGVYSSFRGLSAYSESRAADRAVEAEKQRKEAEKKEEIRYLTEHKEEAFQQAVTLYDDGNFQEGRDLLVKILAVDENNPNAAELLAKCDEELSRIDQENKLAEAKANLAQAESLLTSKNCQDYETAFQYAETAKSLSIETKKADSIALNARLNKLACFEGNNSVQMAIRIVRYKPLTLQVTIKNISPFPREANPGFFTVVTVTGKSFSPSPDTYAAKNYFYPVNLRSQTSTWGIVIFNTSAKPKELIYRDSVGMMISRQFPFQ